MSWLSTLLRRVGVTIGVLREDDEEPATERGPYRTPAPALPEAPMKKIEPSDVPEPPAKPKPASMWPRERPLPGSGRTTIGAPRIPRPPTPPPGRTSLMRPRPSDGGFSSL